MIGRTPEEVEIRVGRNSQTGTVSLSSVSELITLTVSYKGERASSVMLTPDQVRTLREALGRLEQGSINQSDGTARELKLVA